MLMSPLSVWYCSYSNAHNDFNPVLFVLHSTSKYTEGINLRYLSTARRFAFFSMIRRLATTKSADGKSFHYNGVMMYEILKKYYSDIVKVAYRKYFSTYLTGVLVNSGNLNAASPLVNLYLKTQGTMAKASSNYMTTRAKNDNIISEVNKALWESRVEDMRNYQGMQYTIQKYPGPSTLPLPGQIKPTDIPPEQIRNQPEGPDVGNVEKIDVPDKEL